MSQGREPSRFHVGCPFCSGRPLLCVGDTDESRPGYGIYYVECTGCGTRTRHYRRASDAVARWNRRKP